MLPSERAPTFVSVAIGALVFASNRLMSTFTSRGPVPRAVETAHAEWPVRPVTPAPTVKITDCAKAPVWDVISESAKTVSPALTTGSTVVEVLSVSKNAVWVAAVAAPNTRSTRRQEMRVHEEVVFPCWLLLFARAFFISYASAVSSMPSA
jgi:hypothetical protein